MAERLSELFLMLVSCGIPEEDVERFVTELPKIGWSAERRRKQFLKKYNQQITAGIAARSGQVEQTPVQGLFR